MSIGSLDTKLVNFFHRISLPLSRVSLFIVFFWFGILKVLGFSPASELVEQLFERTIPFISFNYFIIFFGMFECFIGVSFLIRGLERVVIPLLCLHMITTFMPLVLLPAITWSGFLVPTLEGQYIIKNILIIAIAVGIAGRISILPSQAR